MYTPRRIDTLLWLDTVLINLRAMLAGAYAPGRVFPARQVEGKGPDKDSHSPISYVNLSFPFFLFLFLVLPRISLDSVDTQPLRSK